MREIKFRGWREDIKKMIYPGTPNTDHIEIRPIVWVEHAFWMQRKNGSCHLPNSEYIEIIGNIYENPELLEGKDG